MYKLSLRAVLASALLAATCAALASATVADAKPRKPSKAVVKRIMTEVWDTDRTGPNYTELKFHSIKVKKMRPRHVNEFAPSDWVSPVKVVFTQTTTYGDGEGMRDVARITQKALFYKETSWWYHSKGASIKWIERM